MCVRYGCAGGGRAGRDDGRRVSSLAEEMVSPPKNYSIARGWRGMSVTGDLQSRPQLGLRWQRRGSLARSTAATRACHRGNRLSLDKISSPSAAAGRSAVPRCPRRRRRMACTAHIERGPCEKWHGPCTKTGDADPGASQRHDALLGFRGLRLHHGPRSAPP